jgi:PTS system nitrogen regulatory IIA component
VRIFGKESSAVCFVESANKYEAIEEVIEHCSIFSSIADRPSFTRHVIARERLQTTGIGHGVAIAHGKVKGIDHVHIALGISYEGLEYESPDSLPVHFLFVIASSTALQMEYLASLSAILRAVRSDRIRSLLLDLQHNGSKRVIKEFLCMMESQHFTVASLQ